MHWSDRALVLGCRALGESGVVLEAMTRGHGRHFGLVHGGRSRRLGPVLQPGNTLAVTWRARLDEQLGTYVVEEEVSRAARLIASAAALLGMATVASHLRLLAERDPHPVLFDAGEALLAHLDDPHLGPALFGLFELSLLAEFGFGLDLSACAVTGAEEDLIYVSPRSGRAVGRLPGEPYRDRLLPLPSFLREGIGAMPGAAELGEAFRLTGFFLSEHLYGARGQPLPDARARYVEMVTHMP
ncbi:DNA repair protein RecO [Enterovirga sp.]|uniref:DNA repair protein RecO n=1 Tax=Enterovirga sp. TaxID=2026350 RepID=UPI002BDC13C2|nr:DNA repair protein RecO [Enterovirga sp.]HMO29416.1 DNA repair protein RecO [Enterovirga sp.]